MQLNTVIALPVLRDGLQSTKCQDVVIFNALKFHVAHLYVGMDLGYL